MALITINKNNFHHNLNQIALKAGSIDKIAIVLKDNAYGHGIGIMAHLASDFGIKHAVVRDHTEAGLILPLFETILILGGETAEHDKCSYAINSLEQIAAIPEGTKVELKVDTGMHRNGIKPQEVDKALELIQENGLELVGLMTHFRSADLLSSEFFWQQKQFEALRGDLRAKGFANIRVHSHNSAAILRSKIFNEDIVRVGIAAYGYSDLPACFDPILLKPVLKLYAHKVSSRDLKPGERIGYGGNFEAARDMRVSAYDLGYGDGWTRGDSAKPFLTAAGLPILGRVSMDFISLESEEQSICIMDDAHKAAEHFGTISYEITTALASAIPRVIV